MRRDAEVKGLGLPTDYDVGTYPAMPSNTMSVKSNGLGGVLLGGLMAATGAGGALGIAHSLGAFTKAPDAAAWEKVIDISLDESGKVIKRILDKDGKEIGRLP